VHTTWEDANVVGNVYFANYGVWQGRARDRFLQALAPELFRSSAKRSMLHCLNTGTYHLREAMPFDSVDVKVYITTVSERGARLEFDFLRAGGNAPGSKLARGFHEVAWVSRNRSSTPEPLPWPTGVKDLLMALALGQVADQAAS
jgi:acyl-CoA thioesterase FadM